MPLTACAALGAEWAYPLISPKPNRPSNPQWATSFHLAGPCPSWLLLSDSSFPFPSLPSLDNPYPHIHTSTHRYLHNHACLHRHLHHHQPSPLNHRRPPPPPSHPLSSTPRGFAIWPSKRSCTAPWHALTNGAGCPIFVQRLVASLHSPYRYKSNPQPVAVLPPPHSPSTSQLA